MSDKNKKTKKSSQAKTKKSQQVATKEKKICHVCKKEKKPYLKIMDMDIFSFLKHEQARQEGEICERCDNYFVMTGEFKDATKEEFEVARKSVHFASAMLRWWQKDKELYSGEPDDYYSVGDSDENKRDWGGTHDITKWYRDEYSKKETQDKKGEE